MFNMSPERLEFFTRLCVSLGWEATPWRLNVFGSWAAQEGMGEPFAMHFNPLATTRVSPDLNYSTVDTGYGPGNWNSVPVKRYASMEDGVEATKQTLALSYYTSIRMAFYDQKYVDCTTAFATYSGGAHAGYAKAIHDAMKIPSDSAPAKPVDPATTTELAVRYLVAVFGGMGKLETFANKGNIIQEGLGITQAEVGRLRSQVDTLIEFNDRWGKMNVLR